MGWKCISDKLLSFLFCSLFLTLLEREYRTCPKICGTDP
ncbi:hypothetical protein LEP1GSC016_3969 [Leptospira borgpetersenii serovar Hardjo-bovis str. Sponselee]|uniref:Uncharacterized protein n=6 Tax=Leptospira borgpetersenii TaxID=174 RepID=M3H1A5_LEPBO|nr:hypothetical protein LBBP_01816 [Leptospira borgpetersenii serovar Ballum]EKP12860.1 hypothetical protein LEP1GSC128_3142 [Leptospira borgpetersenii str. 200801926]EKQ91836.1 hypothetical protein LEP1GSC101_3286 [Leptospira borgpetersenii str. UI 09149]EKR01796.1 hypothetical protein LEP1GSC121_4069 [Leptospira borgpetersenii serovar Castellonis str. 200801910]EMG00874.1 hypothetical protein LEP1GSC123_4452 [Leptospira borgpetersenii str. 200701203]EMJ83062.1 hypothetical protein LEP1GSC016